LLLSFIIYWGYYSIAYNILLLLNHCCS